MPELPEVENMVISLKSLINSTIHDVYISGKKLRLGLSTDAKQKLLQYKIIDVKRVAKYIVFTLSKEGQEFFYIIAHCGMSGRFAIENSESMVKSAILKHDHVILYLNNNIIMKYNDPRRFGVFTVINALAYDNFFNNTALDVFDERFSKEEFIKKVQKSKSSIKQVLLNQSVIAGIGNIYASEILYYSRISPLSVASNLTNAQILDIIKNTAIVLQNAINLGGSTLRDYKKPMGESGGFQHQFTVYGREGAKCREHKNSNVACCIKKVVQNNRSSFYCDILQPIF